MDQKLEVHDTAFMTSAFRASDVALSKDVYAHLWLNERAERWSQEYLGKVSTEEAAAHCMRNRYFLDRITALYAQGEIDVLINFGSGFSMYPYLLPETLLHIEIDKHEVVQYKEAKTAEWHQIGALPERSVQYIPVDFTTSYQVRLGDELKKRMAGLKSFILLEGVLFFLEKHDADQLFKFFSSIQATDGYVGSASFRPALLSTLAWKRLMAYVKETTTATDDTFCLTLEDVYYQDLVGYSLLEVEDFFSLTERYEHRPNLENDAILNECFYLLKKV